MTNAASLDQKHMLAVLEIAKKGMYTSMPNPRVGCLLAKDDTVLASGFHDYTGSKHAEINALDNLLKNNEVSNNSNVTLYVNLEPCSHTGRTPPCVDRIISSGIKRVVIASIDPNPLVATSGITMLRNAGIEVVIGVCRELDEELNKGFYKRMHSGLPWVRYKVALSQDGYYSYADDTSKWISCAKSREYNQYLRAQSCAVISGYKTVMKDDPSLNVRILKPNVAPLRVVIDQHQCLEVDKYKLFNDGNGKVIIYTAQSAANLPVNEQVEYVGMALGRNDRIDIGLVLRDLAKRSCNEVQFEAGVELFESLVFAGLLDELVVFYAPMTIGDGQKFAVDVDRYLKLYNVRKIESDTCNVYRNHNS